MISVAVTAYNETLRGDGQWLEDCVEAASASDVVDEVVVVDDCSNDWPAIAERLKGKPKVKVFHNSSNIGVLRNKLQSIESCENEWVQICDSDDTMDAKHFDRLSTLPLDTRTAYCNSFGKPIFDYRRYCGRHNLASYIKLPGDRLFACMFNTGNHFVHRSTFLEAIRATSPARESLRFEGRRIEHMNSKWLRAIYDGADSSFYNSRWLLAGNTLEVVDGLEYEHRYNDGVYSSAYSSSPTETLLLPPLYFHEMRQAVHPGIPSVKVLTRDPGQPHAILVTEEGILKVSFVTLEVRP